MNLENNGVEKRQVFFSLKKKKILLQIRSSATRCHAWLVSCGTSPESEKNWPSQCSPLLGYLDLYWTSTPFSLNQCRKVFMVPTSEILWSSLVQPPADTRILCVTILFFWLFFCLILLQSSTNLLSHHILNLPTMKQAQPGWSSFPPNKGSRKTGRFSASSNPGSCKGWEFIFCHNSRPFCNDWTQNANSLPSTSVPMYVGLTYRSETLKSGTQSGSTSRHQMHSSNLDLSSLEGGSTEVRLQFSCQKVIVNSFYRASFSN